MSSEIFYWEPLHDNREINPKWNTIVTQYESGIEQRRAKWKYSQFEFRFRFNRDVDGIDDMYGFFNDRQGSYDNFWLPSWMYETVTVSAPSGASYLEVGDYSPFSVTSGIRENAVFLHRSTDPTINEVATISSKGATAGLLYLDGNLSHRYKPGTSVFVAVKVRFGEDNYPMAFFSKYLHDLELSFVEDKSG